MKSISKKAKLCFAAVTATACLVAGTTSFAAPQYDKEIWYYSNASYTQVVGYKHYSCSSSNTSWGTVTAYRKSVNTHLCTGLDF